MNYLAIDTATEACSVALRCGEDLLQRYEVAPQKHAAMLLPMIDKVLAEAELSPAGLDGLVFGRGPGSFTGVRISTAAVQGIALSIDCGVVGISTLAAMAHRSWREQDLECVVAAIDARMQQVYWGCYLTRQEGLSELLGEEQVGDPGSVRLPESALQHAALSDWSCVGTGAEQYADQLQTSGFTPRSNAHNSEPSVLPSAIDMLMLATPRFANGEAQAVEQIAPVYLRDKVAQTEAERAAKTL